MKCVGELHSVSTDWLSSEDAVDLVKVVETAQVGVILIGKHDQCYIYIYI